MLVTIEAGHIVLWKGLNKVSIMSDGEADELAKALNIAASRARLARKRRNAGDNPSEQNT